MDSDELKRLYNNHSESVLRFLYSICGSYETASDLMQETYIRASRFEGEIRNEKSWLFRIASNLHKNEIRSQKYIKIINFSEEIPSESFENEVNSQIFRKEIIQTLESSGKMLKEIFILRLDHDLTLNEIADIMDCSERTVRRNIDKIRKILKEADVLK